MKLRAYLLIALFTSLFAIVVLRNGWIHEDAYITFRTVDNFMHGYGLRWNSAERVQTYTHPLWMFVVSLFYVCTRELFYTVIVISVALSVATVLLVVFGSATSLAGGLLSVGILTCSKAFVDYSTSGLENPLTHVIVASFLVLYFRRTHNLATLFFLSSIAALGAVNRMDTVLLFVPILALLLPKTGLVRGVFVVVAGFVPFIVWELFSLLYYGFLFPNTAYAKLIDTGVGLTNRTIHGLYYLLNSARTDPLTMLTIVTGIILGLSARRVRAAPVVAGIVAYLLYIVLIGGDFISGRFLTPALLGAVMLLSRWSPLPRPAVLTTGLIIIVAGFNSSDPPLLITAADGLQARPLMDAHGIADEHAFYYPYTGFLRALQHVTVANHPWAIEGMQARRNHVPLAIRGDIGYFGFYAGPDVHVVDLWGLGDPLLARLPARKDVPWRVGHFIRAIPDGYVDTLVSGQNRIADTSLAAYYDKLALITRGRLSDPARWYAIWKMNTRQYDSLIDSAVAN